MLVLRQRLSVLALCLALCHLAACKSPPPAFEEIPPAEDLYAKGQKILQGERWVWISHALILHGRKVCAARKPRCGDCSLVDLCPKRGVPA